MNSFILMRVTSTEHGVFGVLIHNNIPFAVTLEPEDRGNQRNISCIPAGMYYAEPVNSPKFGWTYKILDVPERDHILFHRGNTEEDTEGCILVAESFGELSAKPGVLDSRHGFAEFLNKAGGDRFMITIVEPYI